MVIRDRSSGLVLGLTIFNALLALNQEGKAEASPPCARCDHDGARAPRRTALEIEAEELVPGDIVLVEAGNVIPADSRLFVTATLEIEEAALTGESALC